MANTDAPAQSYSLLRKVLPKSLQPYLRGLKKRFQRPLNLDEPYRTVFSYTQAHPVRQHNLVRLAREIDANNVPGALVECGVLDGGTAALMAYASPNRHVHLFDSWEGLPETTAEDGDAQRWAGEVVGSPKRVIAVFKALNIDLRRVSFHKGWFDKTFPTVAIPNIALLHLDGDFYASIKLSLDAWTPFMSKGGYMQIDDYDSFVGCRKAIDEFLAANPDLKLDFKLNDYAKAYFIQF